MVPILFSPLFDLCVDKEALKRLDLFEKHDGVHDMAILNRCTQCPELKES